MAAEAESAVSVAVRHLSTLAEYDRACVLEELVWGGEERDLVPSSMFVVIKETGGQVLGAFLGEEMVGFTLGMAALHEDKRTGAHVPYIHSHMTAVLSEHRDKGIGRLLKLFQRQDALARGIRLVEWTFDPLEMRNAHFNLMRLGAVVRKFHVNFYGITSSHLHAGMPTDRLVAEWWIDSPRAKRVIRSGYEERTKEKDNAETQSTRRGAEKETENAEMQGARRDTEKSLSPNAVRIAVPREIAEWRTRDQARAIAEQTRIREQFLDAIAKNFVATAIEQTAGGSQYVLEPYDEVKDDLECE